MLCVTRIRAPPPIAAARIGTSFASASWRARSWSRAVGALDPGLKPRGGTPRRAGSPQGASRLNSVGPPRRRPQEARDEGDPARRGRGSRGWHRCGTAARQSGHQRRHRPVTVQSSRAGPPRSFKVSFRARRRRSISAASRGTTSTRGLRSTAPSRSTTVKGSPSPSRYFSRRDAGRVSVPRPRTWIVVVVILEISISGFLASG